MHFCCHSTSYSLPDSQLACSCGICVSVLYIVPDLLSPTILPCACCMPLPHCYTPLPLRLYARGFAHHHILPRSTSPYHLPSHSSSHLRRLTCHLLARACRAFSPRIYHSILHYLSAARAQPPRRALRATHLPYHAHCVPCAAMHSPARYACRFLPCPPPRAVPIPPPPLRMYAFPTCVSQQHRVPLWFAGYVAARWTTATARRRMPRAFA